MGADLERNDQNNNIIPDTTYNNVTTYTEYFGLKRLSTASTVMSLKNRFMVNTSMKYKIFEKLKARVTVSTMSTRNVKRKVGLTTRKFKRQPR